MQPAGAVTEEGRQADLASLKRRSTQTTVPVLPCVLPDETVNFWTALGFTKTYDMRRPYLYLAFSWQSIDVHYGGPPRSGFNPADEDGGGCLVLVDEPAYYHTKFAASLRATLGRVPTSGRPRITRFRSGQTRFSLIDPNGNNIIVVAREEPQDLDYGNERNLDGIELALERARIFSEFRVDDATAVRVLRAALRNHPDAPADLQEAARTELSRLGVPFHA